MKGKKYKNNSGFTIMELLVVVAIIGLASAVVIAALNVVRSRGSDSAIKAQLVQIRSQAGIVFTNQNCYGDGAGTCAAGPVAPAACAAVAPADTIFGEVVVRAAITNAAKASGASDITGANCVSNAQQSAFAVSVPLKSNPSNGWCVDSASASKQVTLAGDLGFNGSACE